MKILFFGSDEFAIPALAALKNSRHKLLGAVTQPDKPAGRGQKVTPCPLAEAAKEMGLEIFQPEKIGGAQTVEKLLALKPDVLVVAAYGKYLPKALVEAPRFQAVNIHPSLLPKYRGAAPVQWALLNGDAATGVSTMTVAEEMDAGNIYLQAETAIDEVETAKQLANRLSHMGADLLLKTLDGIEKGSLKTTPQDKSKVVLAPKLEKETGHLDWTEPADHLYNKVRALTPWPGAFCFAGGKRLKVWETSVLPKSTDRVRKEKNPGTVVDNDRGILVACGQGDLCLLEVQMEGKRKMSAADFLKGHPLEIGASLK